VAFRLARDHAKLAMAQFSEEFRSWHDVGMALQRAHQELAQSSVTYRALKEIKPRLPIIDQLVKDVREGKAVAAAKDLLMYLRANIFTIGSWTLDFTTNGVRMIVAAPADLAYDLTSWATGKPSAKFLGVAYAIKRNMRNAYRIKDRWKLDPQIEQALNTAVGGEMMGQGKEVMTSAKPLGIPIDYAIGGPVRMKRAMDNTFGRIGATAELYHQAVVAGRNQRLKGDALSDFVENYVAHPPEDGIVAAITTGNRWRFNRPLTKAEERIATNWAVQSFLDAYPRWSFQFTRWAGEMLGANPTFWKALKGEANAPQVAEALAFALAGWGGVYWFSQTMYENVDFNSMEYVDEHGERTRLSNRQPFPELAFIAAMLHGDTTKAKMALPYLSVPGARVIGGEPGGILSPILDTARESMQGRYTAEQVSREFADMVNNTIPGKSILGAVRAFFFDPTIRKGIGSPIPGISSHLEQAIDPTTGKPLAPMQKIPGTNIEFPSVAGTPIPGATRVLNDIQKELLNHGIGTFRPRRTPILDFAAEDVPPELRKEYEIRAGEQVNKRVGYLIRQWSYRDANHAKQAELLSEVLADARSAARDELKVRYGVRAKPPEQKTIRQQGLPEKFIGEND